MSQSAFIVGILVAGFLVYLAAKGRLQTYTGVLWGSAAAPAKSGGSDGTNDLAKSVITETLKDAAIALVV